MTTESRLLVRVVLLLLLLLAALSACQDPAGPGEVESIDELPRPLTASEQIVISGSNAFGLGLMSEVLQVDDRPNVVLSLLSASMALGMGLNGAAGTTLDGMRTALAHGGLSREEINDSYRGLLDLLADLDPAVELSIANSAWANRAYSFRQPFFDALTEHFDAEVRSLDFADPATLTAINGWASDRTEGRIEKILDRLGAEQALILLNAVWFDGRWTTRFDPDETEQRSFTRDDGSTVTVPLMSMAGVETSFGSHGGLVAVDLPYGGGAYSMTVAVPLGPEPARDVLADMDDADWDALIGSLRKQEVDAVALPRFTVSYDAFLNDPLSALGMGEAFTSRADFSDLSPEPLCLDFVRQKTLIEVDEAGTRAAAVTAVGFGPTSFTGLIADRSFLFAIRERLSGTLLFVGVIGDPTFQDPGPAEEPGPCATR